MTTWWRTPRRRWAVLAALLGFVMVTIYLVVIESQENSDLVDAAPWAAAMLVAAALSLVAATTEITSWARTLLLVSSVMFLAIGVISIFSLGLGFLVAGVMALYAANSATSAGGDPT